MNEGMHDSRAREIAKRRLGGGHVLVAMTKNNMGPLPLFDPTPYTLHPTPHTPHTRYRLMAESSSSYQLAMVR